MCTVIINTLCMYIIGIIIVSIIIAMMTNKIKIDIDKQSEDLKILKESRNRFYIFFGIFSIIKIILNFIKIKMG